MARRPIFEETAAPQVAAPRAGIEAPTGARRAVRGWVVLLLLMVVAMVVVGGITRLSDAGLSITEWRVVTGALPPLSEADWLAEFARYQQIDQFRIAFPDMTLEGFKSIYWWEWSHRLLGRLVGVVWALGFVWFWLRRQIPPGWTGRLLLPGLLGGFQGLVGWLMVSSGLAPGGGMIAVASYWLAAHLGLAFLIIAVLGWQAMLLGRGEAQLLQARRGREARLAAFGSAVLGLAYLQILLGALVAGIDAGRGYTDWPWMGGHFMPPAMMELSPVWLNFLENDGTVQFTHRMVAYTLTIAGIWLWVRSRQSVHIRTRRAFSWMLGALAVQVTLGIVTVMHGAPPAWALAHQLGAVGLWAAILRARFLATYPLGGTIRRNA